MNWNLLQSHTTTRELQRLPTSIEQLASQVQYKSLVALGCKPLPIAALRNHIYHQTASRIAFAGASVDGINILRAGERRFRVDVEEGRNAFDFCQRGALQCLLLEALAEEVENEPERGIRLQ